MRRNRTDIAAACRSQAGADRLALAALLLERLSLLVPRLAASADGADHRARMAVADLRVGINVVELEAACGELDAPSRRAVETALLLIGAHYGSARPPNDALWTAVSRAMDALRGQPAETSRMALMHLDGIRRALAGGYGSPLPRAGEAQP
jgi:hypothetical protein